MKKHLRRVFVELALPLVLVVLLYVLSQDSKNFYFPPFSLVMQKFRALWLGPRFFSDVIPSFERLMVGYLLACVAGVVLGLPIGMFARLRRMVEPLLEFFRAVPPVVLVPLLIMLTGFGNFMKISVIVLGAVWPILLNTVEGVKSADSVLGETCRTYRITGWSRVRHFLLPSALPQIVVGMRLGLSIAIVLMVISEMFAAMDGLGSAIIYFQRSFEIPEMWSGIVMLGFFGFALSLLFRLFEWYVLQWYHGMRETERRSS
jgi:ABC-type nitrate/sulfonate/bicarbonate transport system permease component